MKMSKTKLILLVGLMAVSSVSMADHKHKKHHKHNQFEYGKVIDVTPIYREIRTTTPVKECWQEPVTHTRQVRHGDNSAGGTIAGGLIGGIIGHQFGKGRGKKLSTAVGALVGAQLGHDAVRGSHATKHRTYTRYENICEVHDQVSYEEVVDSYKVTYRYKGRKYKTNMPYDPGKKIKLRVSIEPVF